MARFTSLNFSGGPGALPEEVLIQTQEAIARAPGTNQSILGISHRSDWFKNVVQETEDNFRALLDIPKNYHVLQLQGGSTLQFSMIPILLMRGKNKSADYLRTGYWSSKSIPDAYLEGRVNIVWDGEASRYQRLPEASELKYDPEAAYFHYISNETVEGLQFSYRPGLDHVPRICDMSSDFLSAPFDVTKFSLIYAHAQKNLGPSGLTLVLLNDDLLKNAPEGIHSMLDYRNHIKMNSIYNTPPVFAMFVTMLVSRWLKNTVGGHENMEKINRQKAATLYGIIDQNPQFFRLQADSRQDRSYMNVAFKLANADLERKFIQEATAAGFYGLEGHRSIGGLRASLYNAVSQSDVEALVDFMDGFQRRHR